jgi:hypothetical protein
VPLRNLLSSSSKLQNLALGGTDHSLAQIRDQLFEIAVAGRTGRARSQVKVVQAGLGSGPPQPRFVSS